MKLFIVVAALVVIAIAAPTTEQLNALKELKTALLDPSLSREAKKAKFEATLGYLGGDYMAKFAAFGQEVKKLVDNVQSPTAKQAAQNIGEIFTSGEGLTSREDIKNKIANIIGGLSENDKKILSGLKDQLKEKFAESFKDIAPEASA